MLEAVLMIAPLVVSMGYQELWAARDIFVFHIGDGRDRVLDDRLNSSG